MKTMSKTWRHTLTALLMAGATAFSAQAADLADVNDIVDRANQAAFYAGKDGRAETRMLIVDNQGRKQTRQFTILRKNDGDNGDQKFFVLFSRPADVKGYAFLVEKKVAGEDNRWLYQPGLDLVKRIAAGDKRTSFVGSHFYYEDVSGRNLSDDTHELVETTDTHYVVLNKPKDAKSVEFSEYRVWINKANFLPEKIEYLNRNGELYRRIEAVEVVDVQGYPSATKTKVSDLIDGSYTLTEMRNIQYDVGLGDAVFSERSLRNPPAEAL